MFFGGGGCSSDSVFHRDRSSLILCVFQNPLSCSCVWCSFVFASVCSSPLVQIFCRPSFFSRLSVSDGSGYDSPEPFLTDGGASSRTGCLALVAASGLVFLGLYLWLWLPPPDYVELQTQDEGWAGCPSKSTTPQGSPLTHLSTSTWPLTTPTASPFHSPNHAHPPQAWLQGLSCPSSPISEFWVDQHISEEERSSYQGGLVWFDCRLWSSLAWNCSHD